MVTDMLRQSISEKVRCPANYVTKQQREEGRWNAQAKCKSKAVQRQQKEQQSSSRAAGQHMSAMLACHDAAWLQPGGNQRRDLAIGGISLRVAAGMSAERCRLCSTFEEAGTVCSPGHKQGPLVAQAASHQVLNLVPDGPKPLPLPCNAPCWILAIPRNLD